MYSRSQIPGSQNQNEHTCADKQAAWIFYWPGKFEKFFACFQRLSNYIARDSLVASVSHRPTEGVKSYINLFQMSNGLENSLSVK